MTTKKKTLDEQRKEIEAAFASSGSMEERENTLATLKGCFEVCRFTQRRTLKKEWFVFELPEGRVWSVREVAGQPGKHGFVDVCKICRYGDCYEHCQESEDGKHEANPRSGTQPPECDFTIDYNCKFCGQSGGVPVDPKDIQWK